MWSQALARAPAGRLPEATKERGAAARAASEIQLGASISTAAGSLLQFLFEVSSLLACLPRRSDAVDALTSTPNQACMRPRPLSSS